MFNSILWGTATSEMLNESSFLMFCSLAVQSNSTAQHIITSLESLKVGIKNQIKFREGGSVSTSCDSLFSLWADPGYEASSNVESLSCLGLDTPQKSIERISKGVAEILKAQLTPEIAAIHSDTVKTKKALKNVRKAIESQGKNINRIKHGVNQFLTEYDDSVSCTDHDEVKYTPRVSEKQLEMLKEAYKLYSKGMNCSSAAERVFKENKKSGVYSSIRVFKTAVYRYCKKIDKKN